MGSRVKEEVAIVLRRISVDGATKRDLKAILGWSLHSIEKALNQLVAEGNVTVAIAGGGRGNLSLYHWIGPNDSPETLSPHRREITEARRLASLGRTGALVFLWLLRLVDGEGRFAGDARSTIQALGLTLHEFDRALDAMERERFINRYEVIGEPVIEVVNPDHWNPAKTTP